MTVLSHHHASIFSATGRLYNGVVISIKSFSGKVSRNFRQTRYQLKISAFSRHLERVVS